MRSKPPEKSQSCRREKGRRASATGAVHTRIMDPTQGGCRSSSTDKHMRLHKNKIPTITLTTTVTAAQQDTHTECASLVEGSIETARERRETQAQDKCVCKRKVTSGDNARTCTSGGTVGLCFPVNKNASRTPKLYTSDICETCARRPKTREWRTRGDED